ncbi:ABC transporter substrate-binding protein [Jiangella asiatica]|uniref:ABC transporter substrate-binding protein n=1 Tax=Jiangella asiatica TaxID=2530372 RepID=UPI0013A5EBA6|nr:ABC transporter substrate-binding protein [Jiangella asiatica]
MAYREPLNYDWINSGTTVGSGGPLMLNVVEPLLERMEDGSFEPLLAESYEVSADGREYVFTLRDGVLFHDGSELTADDVVYSLEFTKAGNTIAATPLEVVDAIEKIDESTVKVTLSTPSNVFLLSMARLSGMIFPEGSGDQIETDPVGTGPYDFAEWRQGIETRLERFDDYWGEAPSFENVTWRFLADDNAAVNAVLAGDIDVIADLQSFELLERVEGDAGLRIVESPSEATSLLWLNANDPVLADQRVRAAIAHAIDRQEIIDGVMAGWSEPQCVFVDPVSDLIENESCPYQYDPARATELLDEAGVQDLELELKYDDRTVNRLFAEVLGAQLAEVGITLVPRAMDRATWFEDVREHGNYQLAPGLLQATATLDGEVACPHHWTNDCPPDELLALVDESDATTDRSQMVELRRQALDMHAEWAHWITIARTPGIAVVRADLRGVKPYRSWVEFDLRGLGWE